MMKRLLPLLLVLLLLLSGCEDKPNTFRNATDGSGYVDTETGITYVALDMAYESNAYGEEWGIYTNEKYNSTKSFFVIPDMDTALFLTDSYSNVYYAGGEPVEAADWEISQILFCYEEMISVEEFRFSAEGEATTVAALRDLWFEGEVVELPLTVPTRRYAVKMMTERYTNISYGLMFLAYEDGSAYLCDKQSDRAVLLSAELTVAILAKGA